MKSVVHTISFFILGSLVAGNAHAQLADEGRWGPVITWPFIPVSAANLPDGRVLGWSAREPYTFPRSADAESTRTGIWDPATNVITEITHDGHDMFCAHQVMLEDGKVFVSGGRNDSRTPFTSVFDYQTDTWIPLNDMNRGRWYPTSVALPDGSVFTAIGSGGSNTGETYRPDSGNWQLATGVDFNPLILSYPSSQYGERHWWPLFQLAPDGRVFHAGPTPQMHFIDTDGVGAAAAAGGEFTQWYPKHSALVMYDEGKLISAGGWTSGSNIASTNEVMTIDISGATPVVSVADTPSKRMAFARKFHNGVMLPNGEMMVVGGNTSGLKFNDSGSVLPAEIWNPTTELWRTVDAISVPRNYHSIALLLPDATVLSAGGGLCGCAADHPNAQVFEPPYLFNADGSSATRPVIQTAPNVISAGDVFNVGTDSDITHFSMVKMSSTTHAVNTDLRYLSVAFSGSSGNYQLISNSNENVLTPGYWMLFGLNAQGTPSEAAIVQVLRPGESVAPVPSIEISYGNLADLSAFYLNGSAGSAGASLRLTDGNGEAGSAYFRTPLLIGNDTSFSSRVQFAHSGAANGTDGMTLIIQGNAGDALGNSGDGLGYGGLANSLAIELDTDLDASGDPDANHIAVHAGGDIDTPLASVSAGFDLEDGSPHALWVAYDGSTNLLDVYLVQDATAPMPATPLLSIPGVDLPAIVGAQAYFGFTAGTGSAGNNHDVQQWSLAVGAGSEPLVVETYLPSPQPDDADVSFSASATGTGVEYRWSFGDGSPQTAWSSSPTITHAYPAPGRYFGTLEVRDVNGNQDSQQFVQAVYPPLAPGRAKASNAILFESVTGIDRVWVVNPDNDSVTVIDAGMNAKLAEIAVGDDPRSLALAPDGRVWVVNKDSASIAILGTTSLAVEEIRALPAGSAPHGIVFAELSPAAYVSLEALGQVLKLDIATDSVLATLDIGSDPRHLSLSGDEATLYVSRFVSPPFIGESTTSIPVVGSGGEVVVVDATSMSITNTVLLGFSQAQATEQSGPGAPNYLGPALISPSGLQGWVASKQDNVRRGTQRSGAPLNHEHTVRAIASVFDTASLTEDLPGRVDFDNASTASNGTFGPYGIYLFVALEGNRQVAVVDVFANEELMRFDVEFAPQALVLSDDGSRLFVHNFMSRSVTSVDVASLISGASENVSILANISTVASESLSGTILAGKRLFYDSRDFRLTNQSYMSCASCHNDGDDDGRVWDFKNFGEGLRNTISLVGHGGTDQGRLHWSANFDEVHDFENQIRNFTLGQGLMTDPDFAATADTLGPPKALYSADLDALSAYVSSLANFGPSPYRDASGNLTAAAVAGRTVFDAANCAACHGGTDFTDSSLTSVLLHDVGTIKTSSGERLGGSLDGIDTPTLKGLWATAPYLHDGSASTIREAVEAHDPLVFAVGLTGADLDNLQAYLLQADDLEVGSGNAPPALASIDSGFVAEGVPATINLNALDPNGDSVSLSHAGLPAFATFVDNGDGTGSIQVAPQVGDAGSYRIDVTAQDGGVPSLTHTQGFLLVVNPSSSLGFQQDESGMLAMEAENFDDNAGDNGVAPWLVISESNASEGTAIKAPLGAFTGAPNTSRTEYNTNFTQAGNYTVWVRFRAFDGGSDSMFVQFDDLGIQQLNPKPRTGAWEWASLIYSSAISAGEHVVKIYRREKNLEIDKIVVLPTGSPAPMGLGPDETRGGTPGGGSGNASPVLDEIADQTISVGASRGIDIFANDPDGDGIALGITGMPGFGVFADNADGTGELFIAPNPGEEGTYDVEIFADDDGTPSLRDTVTFSITVDPLGGGGGGAAFQQDGNGLLVMEAENFDDNQGGNGVEPWLVINEGNASATEAIKAPLGTFTGAPNTSVTEYDATFAVADAHYVWVRFRAFDGGSDSLFVEVDNLGPQQLNPKPRSGNWEWARLAYGPNLATGSHVIKLYRREKNLEIDKIVLTPNGGFTPSGQGPLESQKSGAGGNVAPTIDPIADQFIIEGTTEIISVTARDNDGDGIVLSEIGLPSFASLTDLGGGNGTIDIAPAIGDTGSWTAEIFVDDDGTPSLGSSTTFNLSVSQAGSTTFQQEAGGLLTMEAESFSINVGDGGVGPWDVIAEASASGGTALKAPLGSFTGQPNTSRSEYQANFVETGLHYVWVRFRAFDGGSDSMFVEIDGLGPQQLNPKPVSGNWEWARLAYSQPVTAGVHTVKIYRRERNLEIDKLVLTPDAGFVPTGSGPPQSPQF